MVRAFKRVYRFLELSPLNVMLIYVAVAIVWIYGSGYVVALYAKNPQEAHDIELLKGAFFVFFTGGLLYLLVDRLYSNLLMTKNKLQTTLDAIPDLLFEVDLDGVYHDYHSPYTHLLAAPAEQLIGKNLRDILPMDVANVCFDALHEASEKGFSHGQQFELILEEGKTWFELSVSAKPNDFELNQRFIVLSRDITERKLHEEKIHHLANYDELTGLPNRTQLESKIKEILNMAKRHENEVAVIFFDLDNFKDINDSLGHTFGDNFLIQVAHRLRILMRGEDVIARFGGDEFIIVLPNTQIHGATRVAQKILDLLSKSFNVEHHELTISASIGIAMYPNDGNNFETLYKNSDIAMYRAKNEGRNGFCFFTDEMQKNSLHNLELANALRHALERNELEVFYQPQIETSNEKLIGVEALLRWNSPMLGQVSPAEFIPIAEENGTIMLIGEWVLRQSIQQAKTWLDLGYPPIIMAVNLSAIQFRSPNLPQLVRTILEEIEFPPEYLELELTESVTMNNPQKAISVMNDLHGLGVRMSIDDFGTGYSSLSYLKKFNVYKLKIDQSFIRDISIDAEDKAIVAAIINMAKSLGLLTIAEGVETATQLEYLREQGCDEIQGYYYSKALNLSGIEAFRDTLSK